METESAPIHDGNIDTSQSAWLESSGAKMDTKIELTREEKDPLKQDNDATEQDALISIAVKLASSRSDSDAETEEEELTLLEEVATMCNCSPDEVEDIYPCTALQEGMMALTFKDSSAYTVKDEFTLAPDVDLERLRSSWEQTARANPTLRTRIVSTTRNGCVQAVIRGSPTWEIYTVDEEDEVPGITESISWKAGEPLAYFKLCLSRRSLTILLHHSTCDDWSIALLLREADKAYHGETLINHPFRPLVDYVQDTQAKAEDFWKKKLHGAEASSMSAFPPLPCAGYTPNPSQYCQRRWPIDWNASGAFTINTKVRLAWAILQSFYVDSKDILFGAINVGRGVPVVGIEEISGPALTSVPVRAQLRMQDTVTEALTKFERDWVSDMQYEHVGLQKLLHLGPGPRAACGFQTLLAIEPRNTHQIPRLFADEHKTQANYDVYSLILRCRPSTTHMQVEAWFDPEVIESKQIERILAQLACICDQIENLPGALLQDINPLSPSDRDELLCWNATVMETEPLATCIHTLVAQTARLRGEAIAIDSWDGSLTYNSLDNMSSLVAGYLCRSLVRPGKFVPLYVEKSKWTAVAMLAILKAGGAFVLLDPSYPASRLRQMCKTVQGACLVTCRELSRKASDLGVSTMFLVDDFDFESPMSRYSTSLPGVNATSAAYATFTSGSTGTPKGVVVRHNGYAASAMAHGPPYSFRPGARVLQFASPAFDSCIIEHLSTLIMGGCVCIPTQADSRSNLAACISQLQVNVACLTPSVARIIPPKTVPTIETVVFVGEAVRASDIAQWAPQAQVRNAYGPAECSAVFSVQPSLSQRDPANIGLPTGGVGWVVDPADHGRLMPLGSTGELLIEGPIVGAGYIENRIQTQQVFVDVPPWRKTIGPVRQAPLYKTGDLVQFATDGSFRYIGRKDTQVKLHGQRLELTEIEYNLQNSFPGNPQVVVEMLRSRSQSAAEHTPPDALVGFVVQASPGRPAEGGGSIFLPPNDDFRTAWNLTEAGMADALPAFMIPSILLPIPSMPLTSSGKTNRRYLRDQAALLSWEQMQAYRGVITVQLPQPTSVIEEKLREVWAQTLNRSPDQIGVTDSFFRLGGDSVSAMQAATGCHMAGWAVTVADIFQHPSIRKLAAAVEHLENSTAPSIDSQESPSDTPFQLSPIQQLFFEHVPEGHHRFTQQFLLRLTRPLSTERIRNAAENVVERHSMLRARFHHEGNGQWVQSIASDIQTSIILREHWVSSCDDEAELKQIFGEGHGMLNIEQGPLLAVDIIRDESGKTFIGLMAHHLAVDLVSWRVILQDLEDILSSGRALQHPSLPFQEWCRMQREYAINMMDPTASLATTVPDAPLDYWGSEIKQNTWGKVIQRTVRLPQETTRAVLGAANDALNTKPDEILQAAVLHSFMKAFPDRPCPTIYTEAHGREPWDARLNVARTVGWFTTMAPLVVRAYPGQDITETVRLTKDARRAIPRNGWPYFTARHYHPDGRRHDHEGHMEILFNYTGLFQQLERPGALLQLAAAPDHDLVPTPSDLPRFALIDVSAIVVDGSLHVTFMHHNSMAHQDRLLEWPEMFQLTLQEIPHVLSQQQQLTLSDLPLLPLKTDQELQAVLAATAQKCETQQDKIEDIYPCTPIQLGMWVGQLKDADMYWSQMKLVVCPSLDNEAPVDVQQVRSAWQQVVNRHPILRTIFLDGINGLGSPMQVVLKSVDADVVTVSDGFEVGTGLCPNTPTKPAHRLLLKNKTDGGVSCKLIIHHTLTDGVSTQILLSDFRDAYNGLLDDSPGTPYSAYVEYLLDQPKDRSEQYWTDYLSGLEPCLFPSLPSPSQGQESGTIRSTRLDFGSTASLLPLCNQLEATISNVLQVAWGLVLREYTGSDSVCFGYLISGRDIDLHGASRITGPLVNLLICRLSIADNPSLWSMVQDNQEEQGRSMQNQHWSMVRVMHSLGLAAQPLFNTAMSVQMGTTQSDQGSSCVGAIVLEGGHDATEYNITINIAVDEDRVYGDLTYWVDSMGSEQAELIADTFQQIVMQLLDPCNKVLNDIDFLGPKNGSQIQDWNSHVPDALQMCIHSGISKQSLARPGASAVSAWDGQLTYGELERITSLWAAVLCDRGVTSEVFVPICSGKSKWCAVAAVAVMKAGAAFILLDPSHPAERLRDQVQQNFECRLILASAEYGALAASLASTSITFDDLMKTSDMDMTASASPLQAASPKSAAYATFTSGTTGNPKASVIEHASFCSSAAAHSKSLNVHEQSRVLQFASFAFDASIVEIFTTLLSGGCVCIVSQSDKEGRLEEAIYEHEVTWTLLTPSVARILAPNQVPTVKTLVLGGEAMTTEDVRRWSPYVQLINAYGPSECSVIATTQPSSEQLSFQTTNIGKGTGCVTWVVHSDDAGTPVPVGAPGELVIEGPNVGRGYVNCPQQQMAAFMAYPKWLEKCRGSSGTLYRTGDLVRNLPDGSLQYLGRKDRQVKIRGQRIELLEVEQHVQRCFPRPCHEVFAVVVRLAGADYLVAMIVPEDDNVCDDGFHSTAQETERQLRDQAPAFLVPSFLLPLRKVPRKVNGKVDRGCICKEATEALRARIDEAHQTQVSWSPESLTVEERFLQGLWSQVLDCPADTIGPHQNFFQLGGDSIAAMKLASAGNSASVNLMVPDIFAHPQLHDMARTLSPSSKHGMHSASPVVEPLSFIPEGHRVEVIEEAASQCGLAEHDIEDILPCTPLQSGLAILTAENPEAYVAHHKIQLSQLVDLDRVRQAWEKVASVNPILRTRIVETTELGCLQVIVYGRQLDWAVAGNGTSEQVSQGSPFGKPLVHFQLLHMSGATGPCVNLILTMHHAVYDVWSLQLLLQKAEMAYHGCSSSDLRGNHLHHLIAYSRSQKDAALEFWQRQFENCEADPFPALLPPSFRPQCIQVKKYSFRTGSLHSSVTRTTAIRLAWALVQAQYQGKTDVVFGMISSGRAAPVGNIDAIVAPAMATVPLRVVIDPSEPVEQALESLQGDILQMALYEQVGLATIAAQGPNASRACSFQTLLNIVDGQGEPSRTDASPPIMKFMETTSADGAFDTYALGITVTLQADHVVIEATFDESVVAAWQMQRMLDQFAFLLQQVYTRPQASLREIMTISPRDLQQVELWNTNIPPLAEATVAGVVSQHCIFQPFAPAVCAWDGEFNYGELDYLSNSLADCLEAQGIGRDMFVPVYMDRSRWTVVAVFAVLKVGAAFVLLDTSYPLGRLHTICDEIEAPIIITSRERQETAQTLVNQVAVVGVGNVSASPPLTPRLKLDDNDPHRALYAVFTSGSTGKPKGAIVENGAFVTMSAPYSRIMGMDCHSRFLHLASYAFDVSIIEILGTLLAGGCVCVVSESDRREGIADIVRDLQPSHTIVTPSLLRALTPADLGPIRTVMLLGEAVKPSDVAHWADRVHLLNTYGPAECTVVYTMQLAVGAPSQAANIGHPIAGAAWVADPADPNRPVPIGAVGELLLQGPLVGRGYLNNPEQTAAAFVPCPSWLASSEASKHLEGSTVYRTGDLVRYEDDGSLWFVGRRDCQVKLRGQRFELGEVEEQVQQAFQGTLTDVVALIITPSKGLQNPYLVAFMVPRDVEGAHEQSPSPIPPLPVIKLADYTKMAANAQQHLEHTLPSYMLPSAMIPLRQMPRGIGGKLDRRSLHDAVATVSRQHLEIFALEGAKRQDTSTDDERTLQHIWARVLSISPSDIGAEDSFFRLGGDSVSALLAAKQARAAGINHTVADLFHWRTIVQVARRSAQNADHGVQSSPDMGSALPCSPAQRGMLMTQIKDNTSYTPSFLWKVLQTPSRRDSGIDVGLSLDRLIAAWHQVVARHPALRTAFRQDPSAAGQFQQVVLQEVQPRVEVLEDVPAEDIKNNVPLPLASLSPKVTQLDGETAPHQLAVCSTDAGEVYVRLDVSHVVIDAMSFGIIERELCQAYDSSLQAGPQSDAYQSYIVLSQEQSSVDAFNYWQGYLENAVPCHLPVEKHENDNPAVAGLDQLNVTLSNSASEIDSFCRGTDWTSSSLLYFAWALTLRAFTRSDDVCFGTATSGRFLPIDGIDGSVGQFSNISVCRVRMSEGVTAEEVAVGLQEDFSNVLSYHAFPLMEIARAAGIPMEDLASTAINVLYGSSAMNKEQQSLYLDRVGGKDSVSHDLILYILPEENSDMNVTMSYRSSTVSSLLATQLFEYFDYAVSLLLQGPQGHVRDLELLTPRDRNRLLHWNTTLPTPPAHTVHELIESRVMEFPDHVAATGSDGTLTYRELNDMATRIAESLIQQGVYAGQCVPLCLEKSRWTLVAMLAVLKAGGTIVPLEPTQPTSRLKDICQRVDATLILTSPALVSLSRALAPEVLEIGDSTLAHQSADGEYSGASSQLSVSPSQTLYILFTSGTTGVPKGVKISHSSYCYGAGHHIRALGLSHTSRVLQISSYSFDVSLTEILTTLIAGGTVCTITEPEKSSILTDGACPFPVSHAYLTPSLASALDPKNSDWIETLVLQGEPMSASHIEQWGGKCRLINGYGPTECTVLATITSQLFPGDDSRCIGPGRGIHCWVADPNNHNILLPVGAEGELLLGGPTVGQGYLNNPDRTGEAFINNPGWLQEQAAHGEGYSRIYKTGDLVRYDINSGQLLYLGRKDRQIKVHGQRVELADVEYHMWRSFQGAKEVVVEQVPLPRAGASEGSPSLVPRLVACVCGGIDETESALHKPRNRCSNVLLDPSERFNAAAATALKELRHSLPNYMVPDIVVPVSHIPLISSGKTDRTRLRERLHAAPSAYWQSCDRRQQTKRPIEGVMARKFQKILTDLLKIPADTVGADDSFYHLGGDSILAMQLAATARAEGLSISSHDVLRYPTIAEWTSVAKSRKKQTAIASRSYEPWTLITEQERRDILASHFQREHPYTVNNVADIIPTIGFQSFYITNTSLVSMAEIFSAPLDMSRLYQACSTAISNHSILRSIFVDTPDRTLQVVLNQVKPEFNVITCDDPESYVAEQSKEKPTPITKRGALLASFTVVASKTRPEWAFIIHISHAQYDGSSLPLLWQAIADAYDGKQLQPAPQFRDVVYCHLGQEYPETLAFWKSNLQGVSTASTDPFGTTSIPSSPSPNNTAPMTIRREIKHDLHMRDTTVFTLVRASIAWTISRHASQPDIILGQVSHGRGGSPLPGIESVLGPCINLLPVRISINQGFTVADLLRHVHAQHTATATHDFMPLDQIISKCTDLPKDTTLGCLVHHQPAPSGNKYAVGGVETTSSVSWHNATQPPGQLLIICLERDSGSLDVLMTFPADTIAKPRAEKLADDIADSVRLFSTSMDHPLDMLPHSNVAGKQGVPVQEATLPN